MASTQTHTHHAIDYIEFEVTDLNRAKLFFGKSFGWKFNDYGPEYMGIQRDNGEVGGMRLVKNISTGGPLVILYSSTLEDSLKSVKANGGVITKEIFSFPGGRRFQFKDPSGNELAVWSDK